MLVSFVFKFVKAVAVVAINHTPVSFWLLILITAKTWRAFKNSITVHQHKAMSGFEEVTMC